MENRGKVLGVIGDVDFVTYGGTLVYSGGAHSDGLAELVEPPSDDVEEDDPAARWTLYSFDVPRLTAEQAATEWWFKSLAKVAETMDTRKDVMLDMLASTDPYMRAVAYLDILNYHGAANFDQYPLSMTRGEVNKRYANTYKALKKLEAGGRRRE